MNDNELFWIVGLLEGEGCFALTYPKGNSYAYPRVVLHMTDLDVVKKYIKITGATFHKGTTKIGHKQSYIATLSGKKAVLLMKKVYPHMGLRRRRKIKHILLTKGNYVDRSR